MHNSFLVFLENREDEQAFIRGLVANPADYGRWLIFADWLEERSDPRGELIRVLVKIPTRREFLKKNEIFIKRADEILYGNNFSAEFIRLLWRAFQPLQMAASMKITLMQLKQIYDLIKRNSDPETTLRHIDVILNAFGVEEVEATDREGDTMRLLYVNRGDTYNLTVAYDEERGQFLFTSWGDWYERNNYWDI